MSFQKEQLETRLSLQIPGARIHKSREFFKNSFISNEFPIADFSCFVW